MKIQILSGGLANQIRHYIFVRYAERLYPKETWFFDDSFFFVHQVHNGYELERVFGLKLNLLSDYYEKDTWEKIIQNRVKEIILPQTLFDMGIPIVMFEGRHQGYKEAFSGKIIAPDYPHLGFHPEYLDLAYENIYYHADWASKKWFSAYEEENLKELAFPELTGKRNLEYADMIRGSFSVGIHVRRGDFLLPHIDWVVPNASFREASKKILDTHSDAHFFVFSDDLEWCRVHADELGFTLPKHTTYVSGNTGALNYIDMQLLSMCRGIVRNEESSFSQVAGWLNQNLEFEMKLKNERSAHK